MREDQIQGGSEKCLKGKPYKAERDNEKTRDRKPMAEKTLWTEKSDWYTALKKDDDNILLETVDNCHIIFPYSSELFKAGLHHLSRINKGCASSCLSQQK